MTAALAIRGRPIVVKLGGSHAFAPHLKEWLTALAACAGRVVVVPGGGRFADAVRAAQPKMGFDDSAAHHMALLAMEQYGRALADLGSGFSLAASPTAIRRILRQGGVPVWAAAAMVLAAPDIPASWEVTSDSLALWLGRRLGAAGVLLVKPAACDGVFATAGDLASRGIVDPQFPRFLARTGVAAAIAGPADHAAAAAAICGGLLPGRRIGLP